MTVQFSSVRQELNSQTQFGCEIAFTKLSTRQTFLNVTVKLKQIFNSLLLYGHLISADQRTDPLQRFLIRTIEYILKT